MTSATDRFKALLANALERVCVLEEQLEVAQQRIGELEAQLAEHQVMHHDAEGGTDAERDDRAAAAAGRS